jgi:iron complex outermembrane receptor protein
MRKALPLSFVLLFLPSWLAAEVAGRVTTAGGDPVMGARVEIAGTATAAVTAGDGTFRFPEADAAVTVRIHHPRFETLEVEVAPLPAADAAPPAFALTSKHQVFEEITVSASREADAGFQPVSVAVSFIALDDKPTVPSTLVGLLAGVPGVAENGQGGQFQSYSIRGVAGQRVMTLVAGVRIVTERRAGATASFVDPMLLDRAEVVRGPFSSYYGSGALGGLVQVFPREFAKPSFNAGYDSEGDQSFQQLGVGGEDWSLGISHRQADDAETPDGERLFSRFEQWSAALTKKWDLGESTSLELIAIPAIGRDIGKPNADFPGRTTIYPEENHLVTRLILRTGDHWRVDLWAHPNELLTQDEVGDVRALVDNDAFDFGFNAQKELELASGLAARLGLDYFGRRGVQATETTENVVTGERSTATTLDGEQDELGAYASLRRTFGRVTVEGGGRFTWLQQSNVGAESTSKTAVTAFAGVTAPLGGGFELAANAGTGFRFAGLSERFFTGTTGRGEIVANEDLDPERSLSVDVGFRYYASKLYLELFAYRNEVDDYIERIRLPKGALTFVNLTSGTLEGIELSGFYQATDALRVTWAAQRPRGEDDAGAPLGDVPAARVEAGVAWQRGAWKAGGRLEHRFAEDRIGPGEQETPEADLLSASVGYRLESGLALTLTGTNLLDETYLPSADELSVPGQGRSWGLMVGWNW